MIKFFSKYKIIFYFLNFMNLQKIEKSILVKIKKHQNLQNENLKNVVLYQKWLNFDLHV